MPRIDGDRAELHLVQQRSERAADEAIDSIAVSVLDRVDANAVTAGSPAPSAGRTPRR